MAGNPPGRKGRAELSPKNSTLPTRKSVNGSMAARWNPSKAALKPRWSANGCQIHCWRFSPLHPHHGEHESAAQCEDDFPYAQKRLDHAGYAGLHQRSRAGKHGWHERRQSLRSASWRADRGKRRLRGQEHGEGQSCGHHDRELQIRLHAFSRYSQGGQRHRLAQGSHRRSRRLRQDGKTQSTHVDGRPARLVVLLGAIMTLRGIPQGGATIGLMNAIQGAPVIMNLTALASGNSQGAGLLPSDLVMVGTAGSTNLSVTLPDPNKYGGAVADSWLVLNGQSGQTINVFPPTGGNINGAGLNTAITVAQGKSATVYLQSWTATTSLWISDNGA